MHFETVPSLEQGALVIKHDLSLDRLFQNSRKLKAADLRPGEMFRIHTNPKRLHWPGWWTFGDLNDDLAAKKFAKWELPDEDGEISNLMPGEQRPDIVQMEKDCWVFSQRFDSLEVTDNKGHRVTVEFVE